MKIYFMTKKLKMLAERISIAQEIKTSLLSEKKIQTVSFSQTLSNTASQVEINLYN